MRVSEQKRVSKRERELKNSSKKVMGSHFHFLNCFKFSSVHFIVFTLCFLIKKKLHTHTRMHSLFVVFAVSVFLWLSPNAYCLLSRFHFIASRSLLLTLEHLFCTFSFALPQPLPPPLGCHLVAIACMWQHSLFEVELREAKQGIKTNAATERQAVSQSGKPKNK